MYYININFLFFILIIIYLRSNKKFYSLLPSDSPRLRRGLIPLLPSNLFEAKKELYSLLHSLKQSTIKSLLLISIT